MRHYRRNFGEENEAEYLEDPNAGTYIDEQGNEVFEQARARQQQIRAQNGGPMKQVALPQDQTTIAPTAAQQMDSAMVNMYLKDQLNYLTKQEEILRANLQSRIQAVKSAGIQMSSGLEMQTGSRTMSSNLKKMLPPGMVPGNVGDINQVLWPFWFTAAAPILGPNSNAKTNITVTQEAAFVFLSFMKTVFLLKGVVPNQYYESIDPFVAGANGKAPGLNFTLLDAQSSRSFYNTGMDVNQVGDWFNPTKLINPTMFQTNATIEIAWTNSHPTNTYVPFITMLGYRVRIGDAQQLLSMVVG